MELDRVTRVYGIRIQPSRPKEGQLLNSADPRETSPFAGKIAEDIFNRADLRLIPYRHGIGPGVEEGYHVLSPPFKPSEPGFYIDTYNWRTGRDSVQGYKKLARELERRIEKGLTIVVLL